jgi:deoxyribodipyrimidine photolyase
VKIGRESGIDVVCVHDRLIVPPGRITSQAGKPMSVFSPWQRGTSRRRPMLVGADEMVSSLGQVTGERAAPAGAFRSPAW